VMTFKVHGPFEVGYVRRKGGRMLIFDDFWAEESDANYLAEDRGCYVFAIRAGGGQRPVYVGKATKTFKQETFNGSNRHKFQSGFSEYGKGKPLVYFVVHPSQKGPVNAKTIADIEDFLIQAGVARNPNLQNIKGTRGPKWSIKGAIRSGVGKRSHPEVQFCNLFGFHK